MLRLYDFDDLEAQSMICELYNASSVKVCREINGIHEISFYCPPDETHLKENMLVMCEGQLFRIMRVTRSTENVFAEGEHVYNADAAAVHLQNVPDAIGQKPSEILKSVFSGTPFNYLEDARIEALGMTPIDSDGFLMDFFSTDKTTPLDVVKLVIEGCGKGELYTDNYNIALVECIGSDSGIRLTLADNLEQISIQRDLSSLVTRLYPYGSDDVHIGSVNDGCQYIDSTNTEKYGVREGFRDYSDYSSPTDIMNRALWEFDERNEERIDVPSLSITGRMIDMSKLTDNDISQTTVGDRVQIEYDGDTYSERVIKTEIYPYEPLNGEISIGRVRRDLFFYLNQLGMLGRRYKNVSTSSGKVRASAISGVINADGVKVKDSSGTVSVLSDMISMSDSSGLRFRCGLTSGGFVFDLYSGGADALYDTAEGLCVNAMSVCIKDARLTADTDGNLLVNGKRIKTEE